MLNPQRSLSELSNMSGPSQAERAVLEEEFNWLLKEEVHAVLKQLQDILKEASRRFSMPTPGLESQLKQENFILGSSTHHQQQFSNLPGFESMTSMDQVKGVLTLQGEALTQADINLKTAKSNQVMHFTFRDDKHWKLQQIQDARNHVNQALQLLSSRDESYHFKTGAEVNKLMDAVMLQLTRARNRLTTPAAMTLPELATSGLTMFTPPMPGDVMVNFYINLSKLCLTVYQLHPMQPNTTKNFRPSGSSVLHNPGAMFELNNAKFEVSQVHKVECVVPWLNNTLLFFTISLQLCQQLKDKISVFSSFWNYRPF
ncbi:protein rogdi homolog isoform X2 [Coregonus clupeaformis]|uniref:protein rogdi homolog isoform X2 n=1 Tax=Coregonus clupeaformis TaxID=59861 RepID=UPI001BDF8EAE|nr:protein rogdi homolog isoform X2 [Coregonus clupeaformis]